MKEYKKLRKDEGILERAKVYAVLLRFIYFLWEIVRSFEIIHKELPKEYLIKTTAKSHIHESNYQFKRLRKIIDIPDFNVENIFKR